MPTESLSSMLMGLKKRSGLSYDVIGRRTHISKSTLHRYCQGESIPADFSMVERIAECCGATAEERGRLYTSWTHAQSVDQRPAPDVITSVPVAAFVPSPQTESLDSAHPVAARMSRRRVGWTTAAITAFGLLVAAVTVWPGIQATATGPEPLLAGPCAAPIALGRTDGCVSELQRLLAKAGAEMEIDGSFGPITQSKVSAYQALSGLPVTGQADDATKKALYAGAVRLRSQPRDQVEARIRQVFTEAPDLAVRVAECRSRLDALRVSPNADETRSWGVFQLSDEMIKELGGTRLLALDPEWNIQATHRRYLAHADFAEPFCDRVPSS